MATHLKNQWTTDMTKTLQLCLDLKLSGFTTFIQLRGEMPTFNISRIGNILKIRSE